jgi:hypothetical protein
MTIQIDPEVLRSISEMIHLSHCGIECRDECKAVTALLRAHDAAPVTCSTLYTEDYVRNTPPDAAKGEVCVCGHPESEHGKKTRWCHSDERCACEEYRAAPGEGGA